MSHKDNGTQSDTPEDEQEISSSKSSSSPCTSAGQTAAAPTVDAVEPEKKMQGLSSVDLKSALELINLASESAPVKTTTEAKNRHYKFWETQPVPWFGDSTAESGPIEEVKSVSDIKQDCYKLPEGFIWSDVDVHSEEQLQDLYTLLNANYVEDDDNMFRFDYSPEFLMWALTPPGYLPQWHCGVRISKSKRLVGFISAIPCTLRVNSQRLQTVEINFLCVHKKLRAKRVAPVLIKEITRRVNLQGIFQAVFTAGRVLPTPVATCRYWHRSLNPKKLVDVKFSHLARNMTMQRMIKLYRLSQNYKIEGFRPMKDDDLPQVAELLHNYLKKFTLAPLFSEQEFRHWFCNRTNVVSSFVVENGGKVTDFASYYSLPSSIMNHPAHNTLKAAYAFYNVAQGSDLIDLMTDVLIAAKNDNFDVFNALDLMDNSVFLEKLKFGIGDGSLHYYLYNWRTRFMESNAVGLVML